MDDAITIQVGPVPANEDHAKLYLLEDLQDAGKTKGLAEREINALGAVADWIRSFVVQPHGELGRAGPFA